MVRRRFFLCQHHLNDFFSTMINHKSVLFRLLYTNSCIKSVRHITLVSNPMELKVVHIRKDRLCCVNIVFLESIFLLLFRFGYNVDVLNKPINCLHVFASASGSLRMPLLCAVFLGEAFRGNDKKADTRPIIAKIGQGHFLASNPRFEHNAGRTTDGPMNPRTHEPTDGRTDPNIESLVRD